MGSGSASARKYRSRAEEMRAQAQRMQDAESRKAMPSMADNYKQLAKRLEHRSPIQHFEFKLMGGWLSDGI